ncbi:CCA tRNA nucleotidyltransferase [Sphingobium sufflavum]|nr:CCA tRNA nucleotidyltransferase [Sphingobium sufflavum]MCE7795000.1 CCA tRNA nucleotidyltransferase [Sphingobium sufflavum]
MLRLAAVLGGDGEARVVGGAVRDRLLELAVKDVDIATAHRPQAVIERLKAAGIKAIPTGIAHGTVTGILPRGPVEITTLRHDVTTDGRRATVAFASDWREDAARRDFTMNALYADPSTGALHDYFGGRADLALGRVRFIGDAATRIDEDHLRILRYFRFLARFGVADAATEDYAACVAKAPTLMALSRERIADEMLKLLGTADPVPALRLMVEGGIFTSIIPEITGDGPNRVAALIARETAMGEAPDGLLRLVALLPEDGAVAERVAARLKLSNKARARIGAALGEAVTGDARALAYRLGHRGALDRIALGRAFDPQEAPMLAAWTAPRLPVSGGDLIARGMTAGPQVAQALRALEEEWIAAGYPAREETLALADSLPGLTRAGDGN